MQINIKKIVSEFIAAFVLSLIGYLPIAAVSFWLFKIDHVGIILLALFFGYPLGSILGILLIDKIFFKAKGWNIIGIIISVVLSFAGAYLGLVMLDKIGSEVFIFVPLLITFLCLIGYNLAFLFNKQKIRSQT